MSKKCRSACASSSGHIQFDTLLHEVTLTPEGPEGVDSPFQLQAAVELAEREIREGQYMDESKEFHGAGKRESIEISGCCARCPTDFEISARESGSVLSVWQDFGQEGPASDLIWQSHVLVLQAETGEGPYALPNTWETGPTVVHRPGSVRKLYENAVDWVAQ